MRMLGGVCLCIHKDDYSIIYAASVCLYSFSFALRHYVGSPSPVSAGNPGSQVGYISLTH